MSPIPSNHAGVSGAKVSKNATKFPIIFSVMFFLTGHSLVRCTCLVSLADLMFLGGGGGVPGTS